MSPLYVSQDSNMSPIYVSQDSNMSPIYLSQNSNMSPIYLSQDFNMSPIYVSQDSKMSPINLSQASKMFLIQLSQDSNIFPNISQSGFQYVSKYILNRIPTVTHISQLGLQHVTNISQLELQHVSNISQSGFQHLSYIFELKDLIFILIDFEIHPNDQTQSCFAIIISLICKTFIFSQRLTVINKNSEIGRRLLTQIMSNIPISMGHGNCAV